MNSIDENLVSRRAKIACLVLLLAIFYMLITRFRLIFSYSLNLEGAEFTFVHFMQLLLDGKSLYANPGVFPYFPTLYTPGYAYLSYLTCRLFGLNSVNDLHYLYVVGRTLSFITILINLYVLDRFISLFNKKILTRIFCLALFLMLLSAHIYTARPDALQILFVTLFLYFIIQFIFFGEGAKRLYGALFFGLLAIACKQDSVIPIYIFFMVWCAYHRSLLSFKTAFLFTVGLAITLAAGYLAFGRFFFINTVIYNIQVISKLDLFVYFKLYCFLLMRIFPWLATAGYLVYRELNERRRSSAQILIATVALLYLGIAFVMILRAGSHINYINTAALLLALSFAMFEGYHLNGLKKHTLAIYTVMTIYLVALLISNLIIHSYTFDSKAEALNRAEYDSVLQDRDNIVKITGSDTLFILNPKYLVVFAHTPLVHGYDMHADREIEVLSGFHMQSKIPFVPTEGYDALFLNGSVRYIVAENNAVSTEQIRKYYRHFHYAWQTGNFCVYKYEQQLHEI